VWFVYFVVMNLENHETHEGHEIFSCNSRKGAKPQRVPAMSVSDGRLDLVLDSAGSHP
jgi:hypothetical protein